MRVSSSAVLHAAAELHALSSMLTYSDEWPMTWDVEILTIFYEKRFSTCTTAPN